MELRQLKLYSKDISAQYHFYKDVLGFEVDFFDKNKISISAGSTQLIFEEQKKSNFIYHFAFLIPNQKIEQAIDFLEKKGIELLKRDGEKIVFFGTKENHTGRAIYFFDEDGNIAEFIERASLKFELGDDFNIHQVIKINEIGVPVDDPMEVSRQLINQYKIQLIDLHHLNDSFCWVGDYNGVFIVVKNGRNWLPTKLAAQSNDFYVKFESSKKVYEMEFRDGKIIDK
ncbi:MAG: VOC family protein [Saprospiraceae bacterium]